MIDIDRENERRRELEHPESPLLKIRLSNLIIAFRDFAGARDQRPTLVGTIAFVVAVLPACTADFPDYNKIPGYEIPGQLIKGLYIGLVVILAVLTAWKWLKWFWLGYLRREPSSISNPDKKVRQLESQSLVAYEIPSLPVYPKEWIESLKDAYMWIRGRAPKTRMKRLRDDTNTPTET